MKGILFIFSLLGTFCFSQLHPFTDAEFGRFDPKFLHQGYLIGNNYIENPQTGNYDLWNGIYKLNLSNGVTTKFTSDVEIWPMGSGYDARQVYGSDIYLGQPFTKMSLDENHIYATNIFYDEWGEPGATLGGTIFNGRSYWYSTFWYRTFYYNLDTNQVVNYSGNDDYGYPAGPVLFDTMVLDNEEIIIGKIPPYVEGWLGSDQPNLLLKMNANHNIVDSFIVTSPENFISYFQYFPSNGRLTVGGRELSVAGFHSSGEHIISINPDNLSSSSIISDAVALNFLDYIILPDGVVFQKTFFNNNEKEFYKSTGSSFWEEINNFDNIGGLHNGFRSASPYNLFRDHIQGNSFVQVGNTTYFNVLGSDQMPRIYKMSSINSTPELVYEPEFVEFTYFYLKYATEWNGNLLFVVQDNDSNTSDVIYLYNGTELIAHPDLNNFSGRNTEEEQPAITGLFSYGELLLVNTDEGVYAIEYDEMSVLEEISPSKLQIYPNPVKDVLNFSEKLKEITVYDLSGKVIKTQKDFTDKLNVNNLPKGIYILQGTSDSGGKFSSKFVK